MIPIIFSSQVGLHSIFSGYPNERLRFWTRFYVHQTAKMLRDTRDFALNIYTNAW